MNARSAGHRVVALSGGVGGARFAYGLSRALEPGALTVIVNTGDDFTHWGLPICPDLDTVMYTLAELSDDERGWGLQDETFHALEGVRRYGGEGWFMLGDRDLATHLQRGQALAAGASLTQVTGALCRALNVPARVLPMADGPCRTMIDTERDGTLPFQQWFVGRRAQPKVRKVWLDGDPPASSGVLNALAEAELVIIGPSNPYVSIDPILSRPGVREALRSAVVVAVSPIVGGRAVKGPLAEMIPALAGEPASAAAVARHYGALLAGIVVEHGDEAPIRGVSVHACDSVMKTREDRVRLARDCLAFADGLLARHANR
jgi:LPPG:FO 2-phospho-L-lactate transferase